jgi:hypothetical protein
MRESVEGITLTPMYQRRRLCISMPEAMHKPSVDVNGPDYYPQRASLTGELLIAMLCTAIYSHSFRMRLMYLLD